MAHQKRTIFSHNKQILQDTPNKEPFNLNISNINKNKNSENHPELGLSFEIFVFGTILNHFQISPEIATYILEEEN